MSVIGILGFNSCGIFNLMEKYTEGIKTVHLAGETGSFQGRVGQFVREAFTCSPLLTRQ